MGVVSLWVRRDWARAAAVKYDRHWERRWRQFDVAADCSEKFSAVCFDLFATGGEGRVLFYVRFDWHSNGAGTRQSSPIVVVRDRAPSFCKDLGAVSIVDNKACVAPIMLP